MLRQTLLTACILSVSAVSASAQFVAQPGVVVSPGPVAGPAYAAPSAFSPPTAIAPQTAVAVTNTYTQPAPIVTTQTHFYTPTYYYYYYQPPHEVQYAQPAVPVFAAPIVSVGPVMSDFGVTPMNFGAFTNARGEMGHVRYPYYSYRRPWYFPGQPSFNVTIPGHVW